MRDLTKYSSLYLRITLIVISIMSYPLVISSQNYFIVFKVEDYQKKSIENVKITTNKELNISSSYDSNNKTYKLEFLALKNKSFLDSIVFKFNCENYEEFEVPYFYFSNNENTTVITLSKKETSYITAWPLSHSIATIQAYTKEPIVVDSTKILIHLKKVTSKNMQAIKTFLTENNLRIIEELNINNENPCILAEKNDRSPFSGIKNVALKNLRAKKKFIYNAGVVFYFKANEHTKLSFSNKIEVYIQEKNLNYLKSIIKHEDLIINEAKKISPDGIFRIKLQANTLIGYNINTISNQLAANQIILFCTPIIIDSTPIWDGKAQ